MGSMFASSCACHAMGLEEENFIQNQVQNTFLSKTALWKRYVDNFMVTQRGNSVMLQSF